MLVRTFPNQEEAEEMIKSENTWRRSKGSYVSRDCISTTYDCNKVKPAMKVQCLAHLKLVQTLHSGEFSLFSSGHHTHDEIDEKYLSKRQHSIPDNVKARIAYYFNRGVTKVKPMIRSLQNDGLYSPKYSDHLIKVEITKARKYF